MFINSLILALSSSIDSLGIGITYGIKETRISYIANLILFVILSFNILGNEFVQCWGMYFIVGKVEFEYVVI